MHDRVRREMFAVYTSAGIPSYLDSQAADLLHEGRENFVRFGLDRTSYVLADGVAISSVRAR